MDSENIKLTKQWIERFVIGMRLCPFAHFSFYKGTIFYEVSEGTKINDCMNDLLKLVSKMKSTNENELSNSFLIFDPSCSFEFMLRLKGKLDSTLEKMSLDDIFQTVVFHPDFQFGDETFHASGNFTNRSPLPMIHILREEEVARAIENTDNVEEIPFRNKRALENLKIKNVSEVFEDDFMDRIKSYI